MGETRSPQKPSHLSSNENGMIPKKFNSPFKYSDRYKVYRLPSNENQMQAVYKYVLKSSCCYDFLAIQYNTPVDTLEKVLSVFNILYDVITSPTPSKVLVW